MIVWDLVADRIVVDVILIPFSLLLSNIVQFTLLLEHRFGLLGLPMKVYELGNYKIKYYPESKCISLKSVKLKENYWI